MKITSKYIKMTLKWKKVYNEVIWNLNQNYNRITLKLIFEIKYTRTAHTEHIVPSY